MVRSLDQLLSIIVDIAEIDQGSISGDTNYLDSAFYDSLFTLSLIAAVDETFGLVLSGSDVQECASISELSSLIDSKLV